MSWDMAIQAVGTQIPGFNDFLIGRPENGYGYRGQQINDAPKIMDSVYKEAVKLFDGHLIYHGYRVLSPEERIENLVRGTLTKGKFDIQQSELQLVEFNFEFQGEHIHVPIHLPYLYEGGIVINDTRYTMMIAILEKIIHRVSDGIVIKVIRAPLQFWRTEQLVYTDSTGETFTDAIITVNAYHKANTGKRKHKTALLLYFLATRPLSQLLVEFGLDHDAISFVESVKEHDKEYRYFQCGNNKVYLKVENNLMNDIVHRRIVASILYLLRGAKTYTLANLTNEAFYCMLLGKCTSGPNTPEALAHNHAQTHLHSLSTVLDAMTQADLARINIHCKDVFDLFAVVFFGIDNWLLNYSPNDLFGKRVGGFELVMEHMIHLTFKRCYDALKRNKIVASKNTGNAMKSVRNMLRVPNMAITNIYGCQSIQGNAESYGDNDLISSRGRRIRQTSSQNSARGGRELIMDKSHRFHVSFAAVESLLSISSSSPGVSGSINPFCEIDEAGFICTDRMPQVDDLYELQKHLINM